MHSLSYQYWFILYFSLFNTITKYLIYGQMEIHSTSALVSYFVFALFYEHLFLFSLFCYLIYCYHQLFRRIFIVSNCGANDYQLNRYNGVEAVSLIFSYKWVSFLWIFNFFPKLSWNKEKKLDFDKRVLTIFYFIEFLNVFIFELLSSAIFFFVKFLYFLRNFIFSLNFCVFSDPLSFILFVLWLNYVHNYHFMWRHLLKW